jgi:ERCC4-type nuclease
MKLYIDIREEALYQKCYELLKNSGSSSASAATSVELIHVPLNLGDAMLEFNDGNPAIIYERKCLADLVASIKDGRYEEQSYRLLNASDMHSHNIIYIVEGVLHQMRNPVEKKMVMSSITSLMLFKGFSVMRTISVGDTAEFIVSNVLKIGKDLEKGKQFAYKNGKTPASTIRHEHTPNTCVEVETNASSCSSNTSIVEEQLHENTENGVDEKRIEDESNHTSKINESVNTTANSIPIKNAESAEIKPYCHVVKKVKKENVTPENIGEIILCQIPSISAVNAVQIMKHYGGSLYELMNAVKNGNDGLENIKIEGSGGKSRKMSKAVVENLRKYLIYGAAGEALVDGCNM